MPKNTAGTGGGREWLYSLQVMSNTKSFATQDGQIYMTNYMDMCTIHMDQIPKQKQSKQHQQQQQKTDSRQRQRDRDRDGEISRDRQTEREKARDR